MLPYGFPVHLIEDKSQQRGLESFFQDFSVNRYPSYGMGHFILAYYAAFPRLITPDLLYQIWLNFGQYHEQGQVRTINRVAVADLLLSSLFIEVGHEVFEMANQVRLALSWHHHEMTKSGSSSSNPYGLQPIEEIAKFTLCYLDKKKVTPNSDYYEQQWWTAKSYLDPVEVNEYLVRNLHDAKTTGQKLKYTRAVKEIAKRYELNEQEGLVKAQGDIPTDFWKLSKYAEIERYLLFDDQKSAADAYRSLSERGLAEGINAGRNNYALRIDSELVEPILIKGAKGGLGFALSLYFKKIFIKRGITEKDIDTLSLAVKKSDNEISLIKYQQNTKPQNLQNQQVIVETLASTDKDILLLIHGIIGGDYGMLDAIYNYTNLHEYYGAVLTFVYENLGSSIEDVGKRLSEMLQAVELVDKRLIIIAHGTGGLMARSFIEDHGGEALVRKLVQAGTPNGGSQQFSNVGSIISSLNFLIIFAFRFLPFSSKEIISKIRSLLSLKKINILHSMYDMSPGSDSIKRLNDKDKSPPDVPYFLIAGIINSQSFSAQNTSWFGKLLTGTQKVYAGLNFGDQPNDIAVTIESMKALPWDFEAIEEIPCIHIEYFYAEAGLKALIKVLNMSHSEFSK